MPTYYHVDRASSLSSGKKIQLARDFSSVDIWNVQELYSKQDATDRALSLYSEGISSHGIQYLLTQGIVIFHPGSNVPQQIAPAVPMTEAIFELIRKTEFPDKPSRFQSMFGWCDLSQARHFKASCAVDATIYEIESDNAFIADQNLLYLGASVIGAYELARQYWSGYRSSNVKLEAVIPLPSVVGNAI